MNKRIEIMTGLLKESYFVYKESTNLFIIAKQLSKIIDECEKVQSGIISLLIDINQVWPKPNMLLASYKLRLPRLKIY